MSFKSGLDGVSLTHSLVNLISPTYEYSGYPIKIVDLWRANADFDGCFLESFGS